MVDDKNLEPDAGAARWHGPTHGVAGLPGRNDIRNHLLSSGLPKCEFRLQRVS